MVVIEMNPRVSRCSALASKATGFPIAKIAAKLAVGYTLDEIPNDITQETPACFEPTIDYCVVKIPASPSRSSPAPTPPWASQMKSVGEAMAIGRTFKEAFQKGVRSLEMGYHGLGGYGKELLDITARGSREERDELLEEVREGLARPNAERLFHIRYALQLGMGVEEIYELSHIDPWFVHNMREIVRGGGGPGRTRRRAARAPKSSQRVKSTGLLRPAAGLPAGDERGGGPAPAPGCGHQAGLQAGGHLRRRVRGLHALLLFHLRAGATSRCPPRAARTQRR